LIHFIQRGQVLFAEIVLFGCAEQTAVSLEAFSLTGFWPENSKLLLGLCQ